MSYGIDIKGIDKAELLAALYNAAPPLAHAFLPSLGNDMTVDEAREILKKTPDLYFDYLKGRVMKVGLSGDTLNPLGYNRGVGQGAAEKVVEAIRNRQNAPKNKKNAPKNKIKVGDFGARASKQGGVTAYFPSSKERVTRNMSLEQIIGTLSEGDYASRQTLVGVSKAIAEIDPNSIPMDGMDYMCFLKVDTLRLYGRNIVALHRVCENDFAKTATVLRGWQLGLVSKDAIQTSVAAVLDGQRPN